MEAQQRMITNVKAQAKQLETNLKRELALRDEWRKEDRKDDLAKITKLDDRCAILEKLLKFSNL